MISFSFSIPFQRIMIPFPSHPVEVFLRHYQVSITPNNRYHVALGPIIDESVIDINTEIETIFNRSIDGHRLGKIIWKWIQRKYDKNVLRNWSKLTVTTYLAENLLLIGRQLY